GFGGGAACWSEGISLNNPGGNSQVSECIVFGSGANRNSMSKGINLTSDIQGTQIRFTRNLVTNADIALYASGPGGIEGLHITNSDFVTVTNGIYLDFNTSGYRHPHFDIDGNHIQSFGGYS